MGGHRSALRAFRHTATVGAMKLLTGIANIMTEETKQLDVITKQLVAEEKKKGSGNARKSQFVRDQKEINSHLKTLQELFNEGFEQ